VACLVAETHAGLTLVLVQRIGVDLGVALVVDVLGDGVTSASGHGSKDDNGSGHSSHDNTGDNNTSHNAEEGEAGLFLGLTLGQRV